MQHATSSAKENIIKVAAVQMACAAEHQQNIDLADKLVRQAAADGANIVLLQELFETPYFCQTEDPAHYSLATEVDENPAILHFQKLAKELAVVLPISFFEKCGQVFFNSLAVIDADGTVLGVYRKGHIPDGPGYEEKFYFSPGDTGFKVWQTSYATIGVGVCWDQWFPECARLMALQGAELLFYPTAIGSEPPDPSYDSQAHWQLCMQGHAAANLMPVIAANRIGTEYQGDSEITFYGSSFITDAQGQIVIKADRSSETIISAEFDLHKLAEARASWGLFRDRRPDIYQLLCTLDGKLDSKLDNKLDSKLDNRSDGE